MPDEVKKEALRELDRLSKMPAAAAEYTVARTYIDWLVALPWAKRTDEVIDLAADQGRARRRSLRPRAGQGPHPRVPRGPQAQARHEGPDPVLRRPSGRRQDLARQVDRDVARPQVRPRLARRHARRGRDPRPPAHLHRRAARPDHPGPAARRVEATRCSCSTRSTSSAPTSAATRRRRCSRCSIRSRTTRSAITTSTCRSICRRCCSSPPPTCSTRFRRPLRDRMEVIELAGYTEEEKLQIARDHLVARQIANHGLTPDDGDVHRRGAVGDHPRLHARGRRPQPRARDRRRSAARSRAGRPKGRAGSVTS